ncbi:hypothetical protein [Cyanobacterium sp. uoEpiScrs1]|uniref:hypothetical protein n=1 Tax=Cyanobacterium sp. uoEpiScrs1 TaxID=2976343 RepID=UPI002269C901|nr:hypothetical protein [Cyanobacterium sp. uoEpiScrs1]
MASLPGLAKTDSILVVDSLATITLGYKIMLLMTLEEIPYNVCGISSLSST